MLEVCIIYLKYANNAATATTPTVTTPATATTGGETQAHPIAYSPATNIKLPVEMGSGIIDP